jgi:hypothetical protein
MILVAHQPHFLPWLGYLDRMARADLFVIVDHVQFERRGFQNRTMIRLNDHGRWMTVPVVQRSQKERIEEKRVCNGPEASSRAWGPAMYQTIHYAYRAAPFFDRYGPRLKEILHARWDKLSDLNLASLEYLREAFDIRTPMLRSSDLGPVGARSEMLLNICRLAGADTYMGGMGGSRSYLDTELFGNAGVNVVWHDFEHPRYPQGGGRLFIPGLSALDLLLNVGGEEGRELIGKDFEPRIAAAA